MIVAIDGPAAAGKSTVARELARRIGAWFLDTGAMYRAVALACLERGVDPASEEACGAVARSLELDFDEAGSIRIDGRPGEPAIRAARVDRVVSAVSAHPAVRREIVRLQREIARQRGSVVAEGRDTTTVVFPDATHKFFLIATPRERARRRAAQAGTPERLPEIQAELEQRDRLDTSRADSPLVRAADAVVVETDGASPEEVVAILLDRIRGARTLPGQGEEP